VILQFSVLFGNKISFYFFYRDYEIFAIFLQTKTSMFL